MVNVKVSFAIYANCILQQVYFIKTTTGLSSAVISFKAFTSSGSSAASGCSSNHSAIVSAGIIWQILRRPLQKWVVKARIRSDHFLTLPHK